MFRFATLATCAALALTPAVAAAAPPAVQLALLQRDRDWRGGGDRGWRGREARGAPPAARELRRMPLQQVLRSIESRTPGRLLDASLQDLGGRDVYRVRWASDDGRRLDFVVDASSGQILSAE